MKSQQRSSKEIGEILSITDQAVNNWVKRYQKEGIIGLKTKSGQGRKSILDVEKDTVKVKAIVKKERQRLRNAKQILNQEMGKEFSLDTLKRFLKKLGADGNVFP